jgi:nucleoid DNA-binding protein
MQQDKASIPGFGSFSAKKRPARKGCNPATGKEIFNSGMHASFKYASQLKELINTKEK